MSGDRVSRASKRRRSRRAIVEFEQPAEPRTPTNPARDRADRWRARRSSRSSVPCDSVRCDSARRTPRIARRKCRSPIGISRSRHSSLIDRTSRVAGGIAPLRPHRTGRETLASSGSYNPASGFTPSCHRTKSCGSRRAMRPSQCMDARSRRRNRLYFRRAHAARATFRCRRTCTHFDR